MPKKLRKQYDNPKLRRFSAYHAAFSCDLAELPFEGDLIFDVPKEYVDTLGTKQLILRELLRVQKKMQYELITVDELKAIDEIWDSELDLSRRTLVELYKEEMGIELPWYNLKEALIDEETVNLIGQLADENDVPFDLIRSMILVTYKNKNYTNINNNMTK